MNNVHPSLIMNTFVTLALVLATVCLLEVSATQRCAPCGPPCNPCGPSCRVVKQGASSFVGNRVSNRLGDLLRLTYPESCGCCGEPDCGY
ncbi:hypothetical protein D915_001044 [Fasciola hepatica]|uniref:Uncharacterized protein n=1 Tax=Fasciola hepatica TaxID=6192 RepID=A0A4E0RXK4_FASHE|nr:hypothetical protein D915_001044 [Fasciola hepatica]